MKAFTTQYFRIEQSREVFHVGTDAVLLSFLSSIGDAKNIMEVGTGTGIIALICAQRNSAAQIVALDLDENAVELSNRNFKNSPFSDRLQAIQADYSAFESKQEFDLIVCNPPYFEPNSSAKHVFARQTLHWDASMFMQKSSDLLSVNGIVSIIIPADQEWRYSDSACKFGLFLKRKVDVYGIENGSVTRKILEYSRNSGECFHQTFVVEKSPRKYSDDYLELTKDFHVFTEKK